jgi:hypothetical protein
MDDLLVPVCGRKNEAAAFRHMRGVVRRRPGARNSVDLLRVPATSETR